jgi:hypothetical protein
MATTRTRLLTAAILSGAIAGPLVAQTPSDTVFAAQSFEVLPPRRLPMPTAESLAEAQARQVGFFSTSNAPPSQPPPSQPYTPPASAQSSWLSAPHSGPPGNQQGMTVQPFFGKAQPQTTHAPTGPITPPISPAWRWHGYGTVVTGGVGTYVPATVAGGIANPGLTTPDIPATHVLPMPTQIPMPMPAGPVLQLEPRSSAPPLPSYVPPSNPVEAVPLPTAPIEPTWRPLNGRSGMAPTSSDSAVVRANLPSALADSSGVAPAASFTPRMTAPPPIVTPTENSLVVLRSTIETVCAGKGRDLDMFYRGPNQLLIQMKVRVATDAEKLATLISKLPELAAYHVTYEIAVAP